MALQRPLQNRDPTTKSSRDLAGPGAFSLTKLEQLLRDSQDEPRWRERADLCCRYVDGEQITEQRRREYQAEELDARPKNLIGRVIKAVLGQEAKSRRDPLVEADDDEVADVADVLNARMSEAKREAKIDREISQAYASGVKAGIGWVKVRRNPDPFGYPYLVEYIPRDKVYYDWRDMHTPDLSKAEWICRMEWRDLEVAKAAVPEHADIIEHTVNGWASWLENGPLEEGERRTIDDVEARRFAVRGHAWFDSARRRVRFYEVDYRVPKQIKWAQVGSRKIVIDPQNQSHREAIARGLLKPQAGMTYEYRVALYVGPYRVSDEPTGLHRYSMHPFIAGRRDKDGTPISLVEDMIAPQDDYNEASMRVQWMLKAQQLIVDDDALNTEANTYQDMAEMRMKPNSVFVLNSKRTNVNALTLRNDMQMQRELVEQMQANHALIQDIPGVYGAQLGAAQGGVTSGIAISSLVEQGIVAMGDMNDNAVEFKREVFESVMTLICEDLSEPDMVVTVGSGDSKREVVLNTVDEETGRPKNVVKDAPLKVGLGEAPSSAAYQMQQAKMVGEMINALSGSPHTNFLIPMYVEMNPMFGPSRKQVAKDMRESTGTPGAGDRQGAEEAKQAQAAAMQRQQQLQDMAALAAIQVQHATAKKNDAEALLKFSQVAAGTAANEDQLIAESLQEAMAQSRSQGAAPANVEPAAPQAQAF